jgi:hypothetical protein
MKPVGRELVLEVCRDFELDRRPPDAGAAQPQAPAKPGAAEPQPLFSGLSRPRRFSFF